MGKKWVLRKLDHDDKIFNKQQLTDVTPSPEDSRDYLASTVCPVAAGEVLPKEYEAANTEILDQSVIGSCVAHACASALAAGEEAAFQKHNRYSVGYIYANRRVIDCHTEGMFLRQALKQLKHDGDVLYEDFPYNKSYRAVKKLYEARKEELDKKALPHAIVNYYRCLTVEEIKKTILVAGGAIVCVPTFRTFKKDLKRPGDTDAIRGHHALLIIGWTADNRWIVQNSWGKSWGYSGKLFMDMDYPMEEIWGITVNGTSVDVDAIQESTGVRILHWIKEKANFISCWIKGVVNEIKRQIALHKERKAKEKEKNQK